MTLDTFLRGVPRTNPRAAGVFLSTQAPEPGQPWAPRGRYGTLVDALDAAAFPPMAAGTVARAVCGGSELWLGVFDAAGALVQAPPFPMPIPRDYARGWVNSWEGAFADARWMLGQCDRVDARRVARAASDCARVALGRGRAGSYLAWAEATAALDAVDAWARGEGDEGAVRSAAAALDARARAEIDRALDWEVMTTESVEAATRTALTTSRWGDVAAWAATYACQLYALVGRGQAEAEPRHLARRVRARVPLGVVLLAHLGREAAQ